MKGAGGGGVRQGGKGVLSSGEKRFAPVSGHAPLADAPGPGTYAFRSSIKVPKKNRKNVFVSKATRFNNNSIASRTAQAQPGPGSYDTEYLYGNLNKRTFNMTVAEQEAFGWG